MKNEKYIFEYVRERITGKGKRPIGVIVGTAINGVIYVGWSKTNIKSGDKFDKEMGIDLALKRAKGIEKTPELPPQMKIQMREFQVRCLNYFKQAKYMKVNVDESPQEEQGLFLEDYDESMSVEDILEVMEKNGSPKEMKIIYNFLKYTNLLPH